MLHNNEGHTDLTGINALHSNAMSQSKERAHITKAEIKYKLMPSQQRPHAYLSHSAFLVQ